MGVPVNVSLMNHDETTDFHCVFSVFGILERILSFVDYKSLLHTSLVNRRWKEASRSDDLWKAAILQCWEGKSGVYVRNPLFWRTLYSQQAIQKLSFSDIQSYFEHPLLYLKRVELQTCQNIAEARHLLQLHMLDLITDVPEDCIPLFFSDVYFGSFASSIRDSKREVMLLEELCGPNGFQAYIKVNGGTTANVEIHEKYGENTFLYPYTTCFFTVSRTFWTSTPNRLVPQEGPFPRWRWLEMGKKIQVGLYPPLRVIRSKDWGWALENIDAVNIYNGSSS